jgi:putative ABC transport system ATP-binding protein
MDTVIDARNLTKCYDDAVRVAALRGVDLQVERGTFVAIMGPSGSGKSTLLNILGALELPTTGTLSIEGHSMESLGDDARTLFRRRHIGFVFQQFNLLPIYSALDNVALPLRLDGVPAAEARAKAREMLDAVGLAERWNHLPGTLSGGEQQRVAVARALIVKPSLILADEPTGSLDSVNGQRIISVLRKLVDDHGQTVVMVTHDASVAAGSDRVASVLDGLIVDDYDPRSRAASGAMATEPPR